MSLHEMYSTFMCRIVFSSRRIVIGVAVLIIGSGMFLRTPAVLHWRVMGHVVGERDSVEILLRARLLRRISPHAMCLIRDTLNDAACLIGCANLQVWPFVLLGMSLPVDIAAAFVPRMQGSCGRDARRSHLHAAVSRLNV